jgi:hypothetical protein
MQTALFDKQASELAKERGMVYAAVKNQDILEYARHLAQEIARQAPDGITADDVVHALMERGHGVHCLGNAAGSLFRGPEWFFTGQRRKSARVHAHRNELKVWRLR